MQIGKKLKGWRATMKMSLISHNVRTAKEGHTCAVGLLDLQGGSDAALNEGHGADHPHIQ